MIRWLARHMPAILMVVLAGLLIGGAALLVERLVGWLALLV